MKSSHVVFQPEEELLGIVGELKGANLSDDEDSSDEDEVEEDDIDDDSGGQPPQDSSNPSKRPTPDSGLRRSSRLAQRLRNNDAQQRFRGSEISDSDDGNFLAALLGNEDADAFCVMGLTGEIGTEAGEPSTMKEALSVPHADE